MIKRTFASLAVAALIASSAAAQQETVFIQIEARTSLVSAQASVQQYAGRLQDVNGFSLGGGWYGVALGPYSRADADRVIATLKAQRSIPQDAYVAEASSYARQFWPIGSQVLDQAAVAPAVTPTQAPVQTAPAQPAPTQDVVVAEPAPEVVEETPRQARASESKLSRDQRKELQVALKWAGVYTSGIDGAFGRGTRRAMRSWQEENGFEPTGVLTTRQRAALLGQYNAILDGMNMNAHLDSQAGVSMDLPQGAVAFDRYEAPFALFSPTGTVPDARVLLISQPGDAKKMAGLYEIMQTLEIVPFEGKRERSANGFLLTGTNDRIVSHTEVSLRGGEIKGFTLVWPAGDEERRARVLDLMQKSFARSEGVLPATAATDSGQSVDLVSGLKVRRPRTNGSGFFVDGRGTVITSAETVASCERITLNGVYEAKASASDPALGVAILTPTDTLAPLSSAIFAANAPRLQAEIAVAGYSFGGRLSAPTLTFGNFEDAQGLNGEAEIERLALAALPGDAGGPVFDAGGMVMGVLLPKSTDGARRLPDSVSFAADAAQVLDFARASGVRVSAQSGAGTLAPEDLTTIAADVTVLVSCW